MPARWCYLRSAVPWGPLIGCCVLGAVCAGLLARWPGSVLVWLPALLGCCAAAAGFVFDEPAPSLAAVTPRGAGWRRTSRLGVAAIPLALWVAVIAWRPGDLLLSRAGWWLAGSAVVVLVAGLAALAARRDVAAPGSGLAAMVGLAVFAPLIAAAMLGWELVYPVVGFPSGVTVFWSIVAGCGVAACGVALRPGLRR